MEKRKSPLTTVGLKHLKHLSDISRRKQADVVLSGAINWTKPVSLQISEVRRNIIFKKRKHTVNPWSVVIQWHVVIPCLKATKDNLWTVYHKTFHWALSVLTQGPGAINKPLLSQKQYILTHCEGLESFETPQEVYTAFKIQKLGNLKVLKLLYSVLYHKAVIAVNLDSL